MRLLARWGVPFGGEKEQWLTPNEPDEWEGVEMTVLALNPDV